MVTFWHCGRFTTDHEERPMCNCGVVVIDPEFPRRTNNCFQNASSREMSVLNIGRRFLTAAVGSTAKQQSFGCGGHCSSKVFVSFQHSDWPSLHHVFQDLKQHFTLGTFSMHILGLSKSWHFKVSKFPHLSC